MSELGSLLEVIHDAHARVASFRADYCDRVSPRRSLELGIQRSDRGQMRTGWLGAGPFPRTTTITRRIWLSAPDKLRVEIANGPQLVRLGVRNGERWWRWDVAEGTTSSETSSAPTPTPIPALLTPPLIAPVPLLAAFRFEALGSAARIGRKVLVALAWPRLPPPLAHTICYELEFDADHGTILRRATVEDGQLVSLTEVLDVAYDPEIESNRFVFSKPKSTRVPERRQVHEPGHAAVETDGEATVQASM
jgi:outer membrane lipoprotein-sorting protein